MAANSKITWTEETWNPVIGCTKVSPGCKNCYAETVSARMRAMGVIGYDKPFTEVRLMPERLTQPYHWRRPRKVFVNSMSDLFHPAIPRDFLLKVWQVMVECENHTFQVLTKRPDLIPYRELDWRPNIWLGVSAENQKYYDERFDWLANSPARTKFLSAEPLLGPIELDWWAENYLDWLIVGGESGTGRRPMELDWARSLRDQCAELKIPFFFKQGNSHRPGGDDTLDGVSYRAFPGVRV